jgi:hypothetical protein
LSRGVASPGEESLTAAVAAQAIEAQPSFGQIQPIERPAGSRAPNSIRGDDVADMKRPAQEAAVQLAK